MSVKVRAKNPSSVLQTLECDASGHLLSRNATAEGKLDTIETTLTNIETDAAALEVLQTSTNTKLDTLETTLTAIETDAAALEVLHPATNSKLDTSNTALGQIETAVEVLDDIVLTDGAAYSASSSKGVMLLAKDNSGNFKPVELNSSSELKVSSAGSSSETFEVHTSSHSSVGAGASITSSVETLTKRDCEVGFFVKATNNRTPQNVKIEVSPDNSDFTELSAGGGFLFSSDGSSNMLGATSVKVPYPYVRLSLDNDSGGTSDITIKITH